jgi:pimeloyl-ACP methyl ester carboxylesterase
MTSIRAAPIAGIAEVNGTRLYYEARGTGAPLLFLHGFTLDRRMWRRQVEALSDRYRVVTYDARGFGLSALPGTDPYRHCDDAAALCEALDLRHVVVIGHSIGAHQLLELALERPDLIGAWVGICSSGLATVPFSDDLRTMFAALRLAAREKGLEEAKRAWAEASWFAPARERPELAKELDDMLADYSGWHWTHDNPAKNTEPPAAARLAELRPPALVISGGRDLPYNHQVASALLTGISGASELWLPAAGHMANMEQPAPIDRAIADFADRATRSADESLWR